MDWAALRYALTRKLPRDEAFGLTSQVRRSAASIAANIAEGHGRENSGSFVQFLRIAQGSLKETETHLMLSGRVELADAAEIRPILEKCEEIGKILRSLIRAIQERR